MGNGGECLEKEPTEDMEEQGDAHRWGGRISTVPSAPPRFSASGGGEKSREKGAGEARVCDQDVKSSVIKPRWGL